MRIRSSSALVAVLIVSFLAVARADTGSFEPWVSLGRGGTEPGIHAAEDGTIYVESTGSRLWRSFDGGASFDALNVDLPNVIGGGDSDLAMRGSRIYYLDLWVGSNTIARSDDRGDTWSGGTPFTTLPLSDRQWIALGAPDDSGNDTVYALYAMIQPPFQVMLARSRDNGFTWDRHIAVPGALAARNYTGRLVSDGDKFIAFAWEDGGVTSVAFSADEGESWETRTVTESSFRGTFPGIGMDGDTIAVSYIDPVFRSTRVAVSRDRGRTWSEPVTVSDEQTTMFPAVAVRGSKIAVAWYGAQLDQPVDSDFVPRDTEWTARYAESTDGGAMFARSEIVGFGKIGPICTRGLACNGNRNLGDFLSVAITPANKSVVAFGGAVEGGIKVARQR